MGCDIYLKRIHRLQRLAQDCGVSVLYPIANTRDFTVCDGDVYYEAGTSFRQAESVLRQMKRERLSN